MASREAQAFSNSWELHLEETSIRFEALYTGNKMRYAN